MSVRAKCDDCGKTIRAKDNFAGKASNCPGCGGSVKFPAANDLFDDIIADAPKTSVMPLEPPQEMQPVSYSEPQAFAAEVKTQQAPPPVKPVEISYPLDGMPVSIKRIRLPIIDAVILIITFWVATLVIVFVLFMLWMLFGLLGIYFVR